MTGASLFAFSDREKVCNTCGELRPIEQFGRFRSRTGGWLVRGTCKDCHRAQIRRWEEAHPDHKAARSLRWRARDPEAFRRSHRAWRLRNPEKTRDKDHRRRMAEQTATSEVLAWIRELLGMPCGYCGATEDIQVDHVVPLARGGKHEIDNLAPACRSCNASKKDKLLSEWGRV